jgi:hypothetical protein
MALITGLLAAPAARAQLIRNRPAPAAQNGTISVALAELAKSFTEDHQDIPPDQLGKDGVPSTFTAMELARWGNAEAAQGALQKARKRAAEFADFWKKLGERKGVVDTVIADAAALEQKGQLAEASKKLASALTIPDREPSGYLPDTRKRALDLVDAEYAAIEALIRVAGKQHDFATATDAVALLQIRQKPQSQLDELILWILDPMIDDSFDWAPYKPLERFTNRGSKERRLDALEHYHAMSTYGLQPISLSQDRAAKPGAWVHFRFNAALTEAGGSAKYHYEGMASYDCKDTGKLASYDRSTGQFHYYESCKQKKVVEDQSVNVKLKVAPPPWANAGRDVSVIGRVKKAGPHWEIEDGFVCDRGLGTVAPAPERM